MNAVNPNMTKCGEINILEYENRSKKICYKEFKIPSFKC